MIGPHKILIEYIPKGYYLLSFSRKVITWREEDEFRYKLYSMPETFEDLQRDLRALIEDNPSHRTIHYSLRAEEHLMRDERQILEQIIDDKPPAH